MDSHYQAGTERIKECALLDRCSTSRRSRRAYAFGCGGSFVNAYWPIGTSARSNKPRSLLT